MIAVRLMAQGRDNQAPEWLKFIWECNTIQDDFFGKPTFEKDGPIEIEVYPNARVIHRNDGTVSIVSKTPQGDDVMKKVAKKMEINYH